NVLFDDDYDSDSSDDQSLSDKDVREKIYSNPLFDEEIIPTEIDHHSLNAESDPIEPLPNHDSSITISSKIDSLFDEFAGELTLLKSFPPGIDETDCHPEKEICFAKRLLYDNSSPRPSEEIVSDISNAAIESFSPSPIPNKDNDDDSKRDIPILKELLDNYSLSLPTNESYHFDIPSPYRPPAKPPDGNTGTLNIKMRGDVSDQKVPIPNLTITRILNQEKSPDLLSHQRFEAIQPSAECPVKLSDLKQALRGRHPMLIMSSIPEFDIPLPYRPPAKPPDGKTGTLNIKMLGDVSDQKVHIPNLMITRVLNQEKSPNLLSHLGLEAFQPSAECPMTINGKNIPLLDVRLFHFYPP
nr:hypothetical protein [Tanacetum cinerariifolium]